jgi:gamma-glutamyltranspeptidase/glutathione hydrolase
MLQALNILENFNLKDMGYNSTRYIHTLYQAMNLSFADRDFYYGDPYVTTGQPMKGLLSKEYAKERARQIGFDRNDAMAAPGDPYPFEGRTNPFTELLKQRARLSVPQRGGGRGAPNTGGAMNSTSEATANASDLAMNFDHTNPGAPVDEDLYHDRLWRGTTSIEAADKDGWVISVTPSGGWNPACIAGRTGVGMSQRMQSFVLDSIIEPFNVVAPHKRPRVTLTPSMALKDGKPFLCFSVQGGDTQDENLLQFFLNIVDFGMTVQEATEAPNINSDQLWLSLGGERTEDRQPRPGHILLSNETPPYVRRDLRKMGYIATYGDRTSGPINAILIDAKHNTLWGGSSNNGEDYGIGW